jgi:hypothetical protein
MRHRQLPYKNAKIKGIPAATRRARRGERRKPPDIVREPSSGSVITIISARGVIVGPDEGAPLGAPLAAPLGAPLGIFDGDAVGIGIRELNLLRVIGSIILTFNSALLGMSDGAVEGALDRDGVMDGD